MGFLECVLFLLPYRVFIPLVHSLFLESSLLIAFPSPNSATSFTFQFICDFLTDSSQTFKSKSYWEKKRKSDMSNICVLMLRAHNPGYNSFYIDVVFWLSPVLKCKYSIFAFIVFPEAPVQCLASSWPSLNVKWVKTPTTYLVDLKVLSL